MKKELIPPASTTRGGKKQQVIVASKQVVSTPAFTRDLAKEIVRNLTAFGKLTARPFQRRPGAIKKKAVAPTGEYPVIVDTSVLIDGRILPIVNSGFFVATLLIPQFVLAEIQHIADSADMIRRSKGRRGLDVVNAIKNQRVNPGVKAKIVADDATNIKEVDLKLVYFAKLWKTRLLTVDFNLAQVARAQGVKVLNVNDLAQALKVSLISGEELTVKITHQGKERNQGVGYLPDGTMVVVEDTKDRVGQDVVAIITKVHQTPAGQLFFGRLK
ncbi:MAG: TRAM domain-containing protein [Candidatus Gottesmanbacteria bacterium]